MKYYFKYIFTVGCLVLVISVAGSYSYSRQNMSLSLENNVATLIGHTTPTESALLSTDNKINVHNTIRPLAVKKMHPVYAANFADNRILMGGSQNVFVGKVLEQSGSQERGMGPETQFYVEVILNIKGNLQGTVAINQEGGYKDGVLYIVESGPQESDILGPVGQSSDYMLQPGNTYLFATRYNSDKNWYTLNSFSIARKTISENSSLSVSALRTLAASDPRVQELQAAYPKEVLLTADIGHSNTRNSYQSLSEQQKAALPYYVAPPPPPPPAPAPTSTPLVAPPPSFAPASTSTASSTGI